MIKSAIGLLTREATPVPLTGVEVFGTITGRAARVKVSQKFRNTEDRPIEAVYKFPLPENAALCGFKAITGQKTIEGEVKERDKAFAEYDDALSQGHGAYLLDEERPNIFTLSVGNLAPQQEATIELEYVSLLEANGSEVRFFLPTTIAPRFIPKDMPDEDGIPVDEIINPDVSLAPSFGLKILITILGKDGIAAVDCPSHGIATQFAPAGVQVEFASGTVDMDRDFVLNIRHQKAFESRGFVLTDSRGTFVQADLSGDRADVFSGAADKRRPPEIIFVFDCSGSMQGSSIAEAKRALEVLLRGMEENSVFNIYRFGSTFEKFFPSGQTYGPQSLKESLYRLQTTQADLGGTEVLPPLKDIYSSGPMADHRAVILITDGEIGNESQVIDLAKEHAGTTRLFTVGIGHGPNEYFIKQAARVSGGASEMIAPGERIEPRVLRLYRKVVAGRIRDLAMKPGGGVLQAPFHPVLYEGETVTLFGKLEDSRSLASHLTVSGKKEDGEETTWSIPLLQVHSEKAPVSVLWARERIRDLEEGIVATGSRQVWKRSGAGKEEIIRLSRLYGLISRETSYLAVEKRLDSEKTGGEIVLRKVPVSLTHGWHGIEKPAARAFYAAAPSIAMSPPSFLRRHHGPKDALTEIVTDSAVPHFELGPEAFPRIPREPRLEAGDYGATRDDLLLHMLSLQKPNGGFDLDEEVLQTLGTTEVGIREAAQKIRTASASDKATLLATAIILWLLENKFADKRDAWQAVVQKSQRWFQAETSRVRPEINGVKLKDWVAGFLGKLNKSS